MIYWPLDSRLKSTVRAIPFLGDFLLITYKRLIGDSFTTSSQYWERRYQDGGNSGSGSYGRLAKYKAEVINDFLDKFEIENLVELGCGDGAQLKLLNAKNYTGVDVSKTVLDIARRKFGNEPGKSFVLME